MASLYNNQTGKMDQIDDADLAQAVVSGSHSLEAGIEVPVISPDGVMGTVPSDQAHIAFQQGFRLPTADERATDFANKSADIERKNADDGSTAAIGGLLRGVIPGADALATGMGSLVGKGEEVRNQLKLSKEVNPKSALVGEIAGTLSPYSVVGKASGAAGAAVKGAGKAASVLEGIAKAGLGSAIEGAVYGANTGISEAILGNPDEVAEHLLYNTAFGSLFGGLGGVAIESGRASAPLLKELNRRIFKAGDDLTQASARTAARAVLQPTLAVKEGSEAAKIAGQIIGDSEGRAGELANRELLQSVDPLLNKAEKAAKKEMADAAAGLISDAKNMPGDVQQVMKDSLELGKGDIQEAVRISNATFRKLDQPFKEALVQDARPAMIADQLALKTEALVEKLKKAGDLEKAAEFENTLASTFSRADLKVGDEILAARDLKRMAQPYQSSFRNMSEAGRADLTKYWNSVRDDLLNHPVPEYAEHLRMADPWYEAESKMMDLIGSRKTRDVMGSKLKKVFADPDKSEQLDTLFNNISEFVPYFEKLKSATSDYQAQAATAAEMSSKLAELSGQNLNRKLTADDALEMMNQFGGPSRMLKNADRLRELQSTFTAAVDMKPVDKLVQINRVLGRPADEALAAAAPYQDIHNKINKLTGGDESRTASLMSKLAYRAARTAGAYTIGGPVLGGIVSGAEALGAAADQSRRIFDGLTTIERFSNNAFKTMEKQVANAGKALTNPKGAKAVVSSASHYRPLKERRAEFSKKVEYLNQFRDPATAASIIEQKIGSLPGAPQIQSAVGAKMINTANFLLSKLPVDPLAGKSIFPNKTGWQPSDFELAKYQRYEDAAENPQQVLENISKGNVTSEEIETLKTLHPGIFKRLQTRVFNDIIENGADMSYTQRINIGTLFGVTADPTLDPTFINDMQSTFAEPAAGRPSEGTTRGPKKQLDLNIEESSMSDVQRISNQ